ncbi:DUF2163 domain-containing protein [Orrella sp. 11846]|uniref:DUF2163 domain-containing protein n=1 Tax=Orrella sp. 11846 TaxID=3409913 RepID=UPI003B5A7722
MKPTTVALQNHINQPVSTLATCWRLARTDGLIYRWTDHDDVLVVDGETYLSAEHGGFDRSAVETRLGLGPSDLELVGFLGEDIKREDLEVGRFDHATIEVFIVNWQEPGMGRIDLRYGTLGQAVIADQHTYKIEIRSLQAAYAQTIGEIYSPECRANFGDARCKLHLPDYTSVGQVLAAYDRRHFATDAQALSRAPLAMYDFGIVRFTSGVNAGVTAEIKSFGSGAIQLKFALPFIPEVGDEVEMSAGCDQRLTTCKAYGNVINFRGEPHVPGSSRIFAAVGD